MVKKLILPLFLFISSTNFGQQNNDSLLFEKALNYYENKNLDSAISIWTSIVDKEIGKGTYIYDNSFFNVGFTLWKNNQNTKAKEWYLKILNSDLKDNDETGSLMEPHTNYKHKSAIALASINEEEGDLVETLNWIYNADTLYRYWGYEGSSTNVSKKQSSLLDWKIKVLLKLKKEQEAISIILSELLCSGNLQGFFKQSEDILFTQIKKNVFKSQFDKALNNLELKSVDLNNWVASFLFMNIKYNIPISKIRPDRNLPHYWKIWFVNKDQIINEKTVLDYIKTRSFYTRLSN